VRRCPAFPFLLFESNSGVLLYLVVLGCLRASLTFVLSRGIGSLRRPTYVCCPGIYIAASGCLFRPSYRVTDAVGLTFVPGSLLACRYQRYHKNEVRRLCTDISQIYGARGRIDTLNDYWEIATFYESQIVAGYVALDCRETGAFKLANMAALKMQSLPVNMWNYHSTMGNVRIILAAVEQRKRLFNITAQPVTQADHLEYVINAFCLFGRSV